MILVAPKDSKAHLNGSYQYLTAFLFFCPYIFKLVSHLEIYRLPWRLRRYGSTCSAGDLGSVPGLGRSPGERNDYPLQCSGLENSMDCTVHGVAKSWTQLSDFHFLEIYCRK